MFSKDLSPNLWFKKTVIATGLVAFFATSTFASTQEPEADTSTTLTPTVTLAESAGEKIEGIAEGIFKAATTKFEPHLSDDPIEAKNKVLVFLVNANPDDFILDLTSAPTDLTYETFMAELKAATQLAEIVTKLVSNIHEATINTTRKKTALPLSLKILNHQKLSSNFTL